MNKEICIKKAGRFILLLIAVMNGHAYGQLTGTKTIPGNYATISAAVSALNTQGVGAGGVTFNVSSGFTETIPARLNLTATGTAANPIVFQKNGVGSNPKITTYTGGTATPASAIPNGIWSFQGSDYVTINGIDLYDPNTTNPATMEYGYGFFRNNAYDGAQYNTVRNCTVTLNRVNIQSGISPMVDGSVCILVINSTPTAATSAFAPFAPSGTNSYNHFYSNTLQNCNYGVVMTGSIAATPFDLGDNGNDVGGTSVSTGNTILNYGGGTGYSNPAAGVRAINQWELNVSYNTINNNNGSGVNPYHKLYGINAESGTSSNANLNYNTLSLKGSTNGYECYGIYNGIGSTPASNTINMNHNTITNCSASGYFCGIYGTTSAATVNIDYNIFSGITSSGSSSLTAIYTTSAINTLVYPMNLNIGNNQISQFTKTGSVNSSSVTLINCGGQNLNCHDNLLEYITMTVSSTSSSISGITVNSNTTTETISNNILNDFTINFASNGYINGINSGTNTNKTVQNNQLYNFTGSSQGGVTGITAKGLISGNQIHDFTYNNTANFTGIATTGTSTLYNNQIYGFSNTVGTSSAMRGINASTDSTVTISKNLITNLSSGSLNATVQGIYLGSGIKYVYNNYISDLKAPNSISTLSISGIDVYSTGTIGIYDNSVYINANSTGATFGTAAISVNSTGTIDLRNNNFVNTSIPNGGGYTVAHLRSGTSLTSYATISNNNNFYAGTPGLYRLIFYNGTNADQTLAEYKARVAPRDAASVTENPPFISTTPGACNLHLSATIPTQCESHGTRITTPVAIPNDYDGDIRFGEPGYAGNGTAPDIGADEGNFIMADLDSPQIFYPVLGNSCTNGNRILAANITDATGIPLAGNFIPRIYYRKNSGPWFSQPGTFVSGTEISSNWSFVIVTADMGGLAVGDVVSYYVIAQDIYTPFNTGSNPSAGLVASNVNTVTIPPSSPNSYTVLNSIQGVYQVGAGKTFVTLTAAAAAYNNPTNCLGMDVVFELTDAVYSTNETFPIVFNANQYSGPANTLTIRPANGASPLITGSSSTALIKFNSAKYITFDGSNSGGTDRNLFIANSYASGTCAAVWIGSNGSGAGSSNIVIRNCNLSTGSNTLSTYGIYAGSATTIGNTGDDNDNITIRNNNIYKVKTGIHVQALATGPDDNLQITGNTIGSSTAANYVLYNGIFLSYVSGAIISQNTIFNMVPSSGSAPVGLTLSTGVVNSVISKNYIGNIYSQTGSYSRGMYINTGSATSNLTFSNNVICEVLGYPSANISSSLVGMMFDGTTGGINLWFNSIWMSGSNSSPSAYKTAAILFNGNTITGIDMRNNILRNSYGNTVNLTTKQYGVYSLAPASSFININYNDYYSTGNGPMIGYMGSDIATLAAWKTATGQDANSLSADPIFAGTNDLRPGIGTPALGAGISVPAVPDDFDGVLRNPDPSMGAYENGIDVLPPAISYTPLANTVSTSGSTLFANISDVSGVPVSGIGVPVLYWKINSGAWQSVAGVYTGGTEYQFDFGAGVVPGDWVYYYVAAQDGNNPTPNVTCNPVTGASGFGYNPPSAFIPPSTPNSYKVLIQFSGMILVGDIGPYPNLTGNSGLFKAINDNAVTGDMTVYITSDLTEDGVNALNQWAELGGSGYTMTIRPLDKTDKLISGNAAGLIRFNGADRVSIHGNYPGVDNRITFRNTSSGYPVFTFQNGASYISLETMIIEGSNTGTNGVVYFSTSTGATGNNHLTISGCSIRDRSDITGVPYTMIYSVGSYGKETSDIAIIDNQIFNFTGYGIYVSSGGNGNNWNISNNHFFNQVSSAIYQIGVSFYPGSTSNGNLISGNYIGGQDVYCGGNAWQNSGTAGVMGLYVSAGTVSGTSIQGNTIQNISMTSTGGCSFSGIYLAGGNNILGSVAGNTVGSLQPSGSITLAGTGNVYGINNGSYNTSVTIKNSVIANVVQTAANPGTFNGLYLNGNTPYIVDANLIMNCGATSASTNVKDNTGIYFAGAALSTQSCLLSNNVISLGHGITNNNVYKGIDDFGYSGNNLFSFFNSVYMGGTCTGTSNSYAYLKRDAPNETHKNNIYFNARTGGTGKHYAIGNTNVSGTFISNYNNLFTTGAPLAIWNITNQNDIIAWRAASGQDANSKSVNPGFVSTADLHPTNLDLNASGTPISGVTTDFSGVLRGNPPDIGAYEFNPPPKTWNGNISNDWNNPLNWTPSGVPTSEISVIIPSGTPNPCVVNTSGMVCNNMILDGSIFTINPSVVMTIYGNVTMQNSASMNDHGILTVHGDFIKN